MEPPTSLAKLLLDTRLDRAVDFTALSMLPKAADGGSTADVSSRPLPRVPVAGSKGWLPSMVEVGRQEARLRDTANESIGGDFDGGSTSSEVFFAVDVECVLHKYRRWHDCFPRVKPFYAVKCNPNSEVVRVLAATPGCGFDCASPAEMDQVLECGVDPSRIIYANPCKDLAALEHALSAGVATMTFDSKDELYKIRRLLDSRTKVSDGGLGEYSVQLVLRLRVPDSHSDCPLGEKYGATEEACGELVSLAVELCLHLVGISFHCGSGCQNAQAYPEALAVARSVFDIAARQGVKLTLLDIGGGFPGWDGSEYVYRRSPDDETAATRERDSRPSATDVATPGGEGSDRGSGTASAFAVAGDGGVKGGGEDFADGSSLSRPRPPPPPLSLAEIARVTLPVLDELFPPGSGVQVIAEPGRYFVEASHLLFARIYAKRSLSLQVGADPSSAGGDNTTMDDGRQRKTTAYYIAEGVNGCFKDRVLCGVNFEPCPVSSPPAGHRGPPGGRPEHGHHGAGQSAAPAPAQATALATVLATPAIPAATAEAPAAPAEEGQEGGREGGGHADEEDAVVMGPSGLPTDVVARKRLPSFLGPGDWLYFSQMGAYTASIATLASSAVLEASFCYVASTPAAGTDV
ncbi:unnamed protein product [Ectocarpus fasciculatus]